MEIKKCTKCNQLLQLDQFSPKSGGNGRLVSWCKSCERKRSREKYYRNYEKSLLTKKKYRDKNKEKIAAQGAEYYQKNRAHFLELRKKWYKNNKEKKIDQQKKWRELHRDVERKSYLKFCENNPLKHTAYMKVLNAKRQGILKPQPCSGCGSTNRIQAHHTDYSKPLEVVWLCSKCHTKEHGRAA
jgi:hypothetical protein